MRTTWYGFLPVAQPETMTAARMMTIMVELLDRIKTPEVRRFKVLIK